MKHSFYKQTRILIAVVFIMVKSYPTERWVNIIVYLHIEISFNRYIEMNLRLVYHERQNISTDNGQTIYKNRTLTNNPGKQSLISNKQPRKPVYFKSDFQEARLLSIRTIQKAAQ